MENLENKNTEEEVSLIDLLAVCLRYRKLICIGTLAVTLLAGLWLFVAPVVFKDKLQKPDTYTVSYKIRTENPPQIVMNSVAGGNGVANIASAQMKTLQFICSQNRIVPLFGAEDKDGYEYNSAVKDAVKEFKYDIGSVYLGINFNITCTIPENKLELLSQFLNTSLSSINNELESVIMPEVKDLMDIKDSDGEFKYPEIKLFNDKHQAFVSIEGEPFITKNEVSKNRVKKLIIAFFAGFFVTIFISFIINAVNNLKKDKEATSKLSSAWNAGK